MSLGLLLPLGLLALAGALLPLLIHLIRRTEQKPIDFPALRWLSESAKPRRRLRFDDRWLLLLRLMLLALIALLLAQPVLRGNWHGPRHWIAVSDGVDIGAVQRELAGSEGEWRWLAPGFPEIGEFQPSSPQPFASLLREFDSTLADADRLTVLVPAELDGLDAERLQLQHAVDWRIVAGHARPAPVADGKPRRVALRRGAPLPTGLAYLRAALDAWEKVEPQRWSIDDQLPGSRIEDATDWMIWLGAEPPEEVLAWVRHGGRMLLVKVGAEEGSVVWRDAGGQPLARDQSVGNGHIIRLLQPLTPERFPQLLDPAFPERLRALFEDAPKAPSRAYAAELRPRQSGVAGVRRATPLEPALIFLIAIAFLVERVMATRRRSAS